MSFVFVCCLMLLVVVCCLLFVGCWLFVVLLAKMLRAPLGARPLQMSESLLKCQTVRDISFNRNNMKQASAISAKISNVIFVLETLRESSKLQENIGEIRLRTEI